MRFYEETESIEKIIERQLKLWEIQKLAYLEREKDGKSKPKPIITISRSKGALGEEVALKMSKLTGFQLLDQEILEAIAKDTGVQKKIVELLDEHVRSDLDLWFKGTMKGQIMDSTNYLNSLTRVVGTVMKHGEAILVGRGTNIVLGPNKAFRVRVTGSLKIRSERVAERENITLKKAEKIVQKNDEERDKFTKKSFGVNIEDPSYYDLTLNTDCINVDDAVDLILLGYSKKEKFLSR